MAFEKISQVDMLVHPFYNYCPEGIENGASRIDTAFWRSIDDYGAREAEIMMRIWKRSIDETAEDPSRAMLFIGNYTTEVCMLLIKKGEWERRRQWQTKTMNVEEKAKLGMEAELLEYAHEKLGGRLLHVHYSTEEHGDLVRGFFHEKTTDARKFRLNVYGEVLTSCVMEELEQLKKCLPFKLKREHVHLKPKKSVDWVFYMAKEKNGYPRAWELEGLKKQEKTRRILEGMPNYREKRKRLFEKLLGGQE